VGGAGAAVPSHRKRSVALEDAALLDFGQVKAFRRPPAYRGQRNFPGWWWSVTTKSHVAYESWLERRYIIEADRDIQVTGISGQPFNLTWPEGRKQMRHVPDLFCIMSDQMSCERSHDTMLTQGPLYSS